MCNWPKNELKLNHRYFERDFHTDVWNFVNILNNLYSNIIFEEIKKEYYQWRFHWRLMTNYFLPVVSVTMVEGVEGVIGGVEYWRGLFVYADLWVDPLDAQDSSARLYPSFPTLAQKCQRAFHNKYSRTERPFLIRQKNGDSNKSITTVLSLELRNLKRSPSTPMKSYALELLRNVRAARGS